MPKNTFQDDVLIESVICPPQPREMFATDSLSELKMTVCEHGVQVPIVLHRRDGKLYLVDGERRIRAARAAGETTIPAIIEEIELSDVDVLMRQLLLNWQREELAPLELSKGLDSLMQTTHWSAKQVAEKLGKSESKVTRLRALLQLSPAIQELVRDRKISASSAYEISLVKNPEQQMILANEVAKGRTRDSLTAARKAARHTSPTINNRSTGRVTAKLSGNRSVTVCAAALNLDGFILTLVEILNRAREAQKKGLALGTFRKVLADTAKSPS